MGARSQSGPVDCVFLSDAICPDLSFSSYMCKGPILV